MFGAEGVATHLSRLFDGKSRTLSVSANNRVSSQFVHACATLI